MSSPAPTTPQGMPRILQGKRQLGPADEFCFGCHSGLKCFTDCCHDVNILLTPVDVLQLARHLGLNTTDFLDEYTSIPITKELHLPVVALKMNDAEDKRCHFLGEGDKTSGGGKAGCTVYENRPWACRMYPLGMAIPPARAGVEPDPVHFLFEDDFCHGGSEKSTWTVASWRTDQDIAAREELEAGFTEIVSHPWFIGGRQLDPRKMHMFHTACYDLDSFRRFIVETTFLERFELEKDLVEELRTDDEALLRFAFRWLRYALFGEPTMKPRADAADHARNPGRNP